MEDHNEQPLPTPEEVLVCNPTTSDEEVDHEIFFVPNKIAFFFQIELFWRRAINDPGFNRIFCLIHAEKLSYQVSDQALSALFRYSQGKQGA